MNYKEYMENAVLEMKECEKYFDQYDNAQEKIWKIERVKDIVNNMPFLLKIGVIVPLNTGIALTLCLPVIIPFFIILNVIMIEPLASLMGLIVFGSTGWAIATTFILMDKSPFALLHKLIFKYRMEIYLKTMEKNIHKLSEYVDNSTYLKEFSSEYLNPHAIYRLYEITQSNRVNSMKEAFDTYDTELFREKSLMNQEQLRYMTEQALEIANRAEASASSAESMAFYSMYRD